MSKISIFRYIANHTPSAAKAKAIMEDFGYEVYFKSENEFVNCLVQFVNEERKKGNGEKAILALAKAHPDRDLIIASVSNDETRSFDGFENSILNLRAQQVPVQQPVVSKPLVPVQQENNKQDYTPILIGGLFASALFLATALLYKRK